MYEWRMFFFQFLSARKGLIGQQMDFAKKKNTRNFEN